MSTPWFFLSYAASVSDSSDREVEEFSSDLVEALRGAASLKKNEVPAGDIGFCAPEMAQGANWPEELVEKLRTCRVLVCLYSDAYFKSEACGKEFKIFSSRIDAYVGALESAQRPPLILPVLWTTPTDFPNKLPRAASELHYDNTHLDKLLLVGGLFYLKTLTSDKSEYNQYVVHLARTIKKVAEKPVLPPLDRVPSFQKAWNAWVDPPNAPSGLDATQVATRQIKLTWEGNSADEDGFYVDRFRQEGRATNFVNVKKLPPNSTSFTDVVGAAGTTYQYRVCAYNSGGCSEYTDIVEVETSGQPPPPMPSDLSASVVSAHQVELRWVDNSGGIGSFKIQRCDDPDRGVFRDLEKVDPGVTSYNDSGLTPATTYTYRVCASDENGDSDYSNEVTIQVPEAAPPPSPPTPKLPYLIAAVAVVIIVATGLIFRCSIVPSFCAVPPPPPTPSPTPPLHTPTPTTFVDLFQPVKDGSSSGSKWAASKSWFVPDQWDRLGDSHLGGWLVVRGTTPGGVRDLKFGNSIMRFRVEFEKGSKVGWVIHARADGQGVRSGYCFLLERQLGPDRPLKFSASVCESGDEIRPNIDEIGITQYGKAEDFIQVEAVIVNNQFQFYFSLRNYQEDDSPHKSRGNVNQCYPASVNGKADVHSDGSAGLFAGDTDTEFRVSSFAVYPMTDENLKLVQCLRR